MTDAIKAINDKAPWATPQLETLGTADDVNGFAGAGPDASQPGPTS